MNRILQSALAAACLLPAPGSHAQSGEEVVRSKCSRCHALSVEKDGPALKAIAAKHKADKGAEGQLVGRYGSIKSHSKVQATDEQLKAAVEFVLRQ